MKYNHILITGGLGFIGSHTISALYEKYPNVVITIIDNCSNSSQDVLISLEKITNVNLKSRFKLVDIRDINSLRNVFIDAKMIDTIPIDSVIHFAGLKSVGESVSVPLEYYSNNLLGTINLLQTMNEFNCRSLVFSSSCTVYGTSKNIPFYEDSCLSFTNPYGCTKMCIEHLLSGLKNWNICSLRYFNPIGAHPSGLIGENPNGTPTNLVPYIMGVISGRYKELKVFGSDYLTKDGTCIRDYIHVMDIGHAHINALEFLTESKPSFSVYNVGTGKGTSVLEIIHLVEKITKKSLSYMLVERREGDIAEAYADTRKIKDELNFETKYSVEDALIHAVNYTRGHQLSSN